MGAGQPTAPTLYQLDKPYNNLLSLLNEMSSVLPNIASELPEDQRKQLEVYADTLRIINLKKGKERWPRSTYSEKNSIIMLPYIKEAAVRRRDFEIIPFPGATLTTMYLKWMGALQWLIAEPGVAQETKTLCALIRSITKARKDMERGVLIIRFLVTDPSLYINSPGKLLIQDSQTPPSADAPHQDKKMPHDKEAEAILEQARMSQGIGWKEDMIEWVQSGDADVPFVKKGLVLTNDDVAFIQGLAKNAELLSEITHDTIRLMRQV